MYWWWDKCFMAILSLSRWFYIDITVFSSSLAYEKRPLFDVPANIMIFLGTFVVNLTC
jgi:hypothetical protein